MELIRFDRRFFPFELQRVADEMVPRAKEALQSIKEKTCQGMEWTGWFDFPRQRGFSMARDIRDFQSRLDVHYDLVLVIGVGGSYLGSRAVAEALTHEYAPLVGRQGRRGSGALVAYAGHHLSEASIVELIDLLERHQPVVNVISKSGTTTEPSVAFRIIRSYMEQRFGKREASRRIIATTDPHKGALGSLAAEHGYHTFIVPPDMGGRYSVLSAVGLVPLALAGFSIEDVLEGAEGVFADLRRDTATLTAHPVTQYAVCRQAAQEAGKRMEIMAFQEPKLGYLVHWWRHLFGESEGKDGRGLYPSGMQFTTDLHSLGQYIQQGPRDLLETFLVFEESRATDSFNVERRVRIPHMTDNADELGYLEGRFVEELNVAAMEATKVAHCDGGVPCLEIRCHRLNERSLGALFAFFQTSCAVSALLQGVNPFDQPGVETYKENFFGLLGKPGFEDLGASLRKRL
jgi:glucose-6-phosphate isomerase